MNWNGIKNGELLKKIDGSFDIFITVDRNLSFQNPVKTKNFSIVVLCAHTNRFADLKKLIPSVLTQIENLKSPQFIEIFE